MASAGAGLTFHGPFQASGFGFLEYIIRYRVLSAIPVTGAALEVAGSTGADGFRAARMLVSAPGGGLIAASMVHDAEPVRVYEAFASYASGPQQSFDAVTAVVLAPNGGYAAVSSFTNEFGVGPEPGSLWLLLGVLPGLVLARRLRRKRTARAALLAAVARRRRRRAWRRV